MPGNEKPYNLRRIVPPYKDYDYFEQATSPPYRFKPESREFSMANAWWLSEASILSYADKPFVIDTFSPVGLKEVEFFSEGSTQCYVASNKDFLILVFRGTQIWGGAEETEPLKIFAAILRDIIADAKFKLVPWEEEGKVHQGFKEALNAVWEKVFNYLRDKDKDGRTFWFTGHSLGAALATLAWKRYCRDGEGIVPGLYTFGSPLVGDRDFGKGFQKTYRFVNNNDMVTKVPPPVKYHHVGCLKHINSKGSINTHSHAAGKGEHGFEMEGWSFLNSREKIEDFYAMIEEAIKGIPPFKNFLEPISDSLNRLLPNNILDHVPILYSRNIKKNIF